MWVPEHSVIGERMRRIVGSVPLVFAVASGATPVWAQGAPVNVERILTSPPAIILYLFIVLAVFIGIAVEFFRRRGVQGGTTSEVPRTAREVLDDRYARGEIAREEYLLRCKDISGA